MRVLLACAALLLLLLAAAGGARAHVVYDRTTLRQLARGSELVLWVEIASPLEVWSAPDGSDHQEHFRARVLETVKGDAPPSTIDFFVHAEGEPAWQPGDRALLFLDRTASRAELATLAARFPWFSVQGAGLEWRAPADRPGEARELRALAAGWSALPEDAPPAQARALVLRGLRARSGRARADALMELVGARETPGFFASPGDVRPFAALTTMDTLTFPQRVALVKLLEGRPGFDAPAHLRTLARGPMTPGDCATLLRVAGSTRDPGLQRWLAAQAASPDPAVRRAAVAALGQPWHAELLDLLVARAADPDPAVAGAAVRSLGSVRTPEARAALLRLGAGEGFLPALARAQLGSFGEPAPRDGAALSAGLP